METNKSINRWRLILGRFADDNIPIVDSDNYIEMDRALDFLYGREYSEDMNIREQKSRLLTVPTWLTKVRELFPKEVSEIMEGHALEKYKLKELLTDKDVLNSIKPNMDLLKAIMQMKHLMNDDVLYVAKEIVEKVIKELKRIMEAEIKECIIGRLDKSSQGYLRNKNNINIEKTIKANLKNYDYENQRLIVEKVKYNARIKSFNKWDVIIAVDESGSMLESVIHSAVMASIFAGLDMIKTSLLIFDTEIVDLTGYIDDPLKTMMSVQLGGGTHIYKALQYCNELLGSPHKSIVVLITDLYENGSITQMYRRAKDIIDSGAKLIVLTSLNDRGEGVFNEVAARRLKDMGAEVASLTPKELTRWIAEVIS